MFHVKHCGNILKSLETGTAPAGCQPNHSQVTSAKTGSRIGTDHSM